MVQIMFLFNNWIKSLICSRGSKKKMKKILILYGSPKGKGNTSKIAQLFMHALDIHRENEYVEFYLKDMNIGLCKGCMACVTKGIEKCPLNDDVSMIITEILNSDGVILASPNFTGNVPWLVKNFFDRMCSFAHRPIFFNQPLAIVTTCAGIGLADSLKNHSELPKYIGFHPITKLGVKTPPHFSFKKINQAIQKKIEKSAKSFHQSLISKQPKFNLDSLIFYQIFKNIIPLLRNYFSKDFSYWNEQGWFSKDKTFFVSFKGKKLQKILSQFIGKMAARSVEKELVQIKSSS
ncbi:hypothetical protein NEF87_000778 [Candidatus Lokiarchaeum ossiferum]|uniref:NADPH-dependent FMN reductase-like domain-containing protein n=1 Tax=Candidatus Lokiarchaeum ossiferum TaxID=2951803 RepID=A0ABY6HMG3_9ARCH|nr:hypothetical protein NEF87_000778 [Candidatus Lokiarchaeum sp. B-35]